ncbi:MAG TPA: hypothetical protein DEO33_05290 [Rikenellaceae bacterium]|nr:hypothetical protein [Rikenellaceae bacterium]
MDVVFVCLGFKNKKCNGAGELLPHFSQGDVDRVPVPLSIPPLKKYIPKISSIEPKSYISTSSFTKLIMSL